MKTKATQELTWRQRANLAASTVVAGVALATGGQALAQTGTNVVPTSIEHAATKPRHDPNLTQDFAQAAVKLEVERMTKGALDAYTAQLVSIMGLDAAGQAERMMGLGGHSLDAGTLTSTQQDQLKDATERFVSSLPVAVLPRNLQELARDAVKKSDQPNRVVDTMRLSELGDVGKEVAKRFLQDFRTSSPRTFYALATAAAAAGGVLAYHKGSEGLERLGLSPALKNQLNEHLAIEASAKFGPHFRDPTAMVGITATTTVLGAQIEARVRTPMHGKHVGKPDVDVRAQRNFVLGEHSSTPTQVSASGEVRFTGTDFTGARMQVDAQRGTQSVTTTVDINGQGQVFDARLSHRAALGGSLNGLHLEQSLQWQQGNGTSWNASLSGTNGPWTISAGAGYQFEQQRFQTTLSAGRTMSWRSKNDTSIAVRAITNGSDVNVGIAAQVRF
jgi:hypothetical protein